MIRYAPAHVTLPRFRVLLDKTGQAFDLYLVNATRNGLPFLVTLGAGAYVVTNVDAGTCIGVDGTAGILVTLVPNARRRLRTIMKVRAQKGAPDRGPG